jgi:creatinine amidohydrolase
VLYVNAHGGNATALARAVRTLSAEGRTVAAWHARVDGGDLHAGHTETSLMLHVRPDLVRMEDAEAGSTASLVEIEDRLRSEGVRAVSANGVLGDPRGAGAEEGADTFGALLNSLLEVLAGMGRSIQA